MSKPVNFEELIRTHLKSSEFAEALAHYIAERYATELLGEFHSQFTKMVDVRVKNMMDVYVENTELKGDIQRIVDRAIKDITKKDLIERIK